jgi:uncharacterized membrane protein YphA (DoxX/SURF4 family)
VLAYFGYPQAHVAVNSGDAAVLYCFVFFYIFFAGAGPWSLDRAVLTQD